VNIAENDLRAPATEAPRSNSRTWVSWFDHQRNSRALSPAPPFDRGCTAGERLIGELRKPIDLTHWSQEWTTLIFFPADHCTNDLPCHRLLDVTTNPDGMSLNTWDK